MGHPRAKRILNEVIQEMKKELKKHTKKRQSSDLDDVKVDKPEAAAAKQETEEKEKEKEAPKKKTTTTATTPNKENKPTTSTAAAATAKEDVVAKVPKNQLMKGMCVLLIDLSSSRYRDALEAVREMGGTTFRGLPDTCKIEGVQWKNVVETKITHVLYPHPKPAIDALVRHRSWDAQRKAKRTQACCAMLPPQSKGFVLINANRLARLTEKEDGALWTPRCARGVNRVGPVVRCPRPHVRATDLTSIPTVARAARTGHGRAGTTSSAWMCHRDSRCSRLRKHRPYRNRTREGGNVKRSWP
jgi:hypothetical protein